MPAVYDKWTFVAAVYDEVAQTVKLQVDDMVLTKGGVTLDSGETRLYIGGSPKFSSFFSGLIDNVFVFGDALTDRQLAYIRSGGATAILTAANSNKCAAILYDDPSLHVPAIVLNGQYYWSDFQFVQNTMDFVVSDAGFVTDPSFSFQRLRGINAVTGPPASCAGYHVRWYILLG
ncbi:MAG: LamG domain-containing protein [Desulfobacterales bacterium]|nr:LamG domain-containing protein [Desulfobacterales bacterium]